MTDGSGTSPLKLQWLGSSDVFVHGEPLPPLRYRKDLWLLAYLTLRHDRNVARTDIAARFWPDADESQALYYLRRSLSNLRRALGPEADRLLTPTSQTLRLDLAGADCDLVIFDSALARAAVSPDPEAVLQQAVSLYRGPLIPECQDEWTITERNAREQSYLAALEQLARLTLEKGEPTAAVRWLRLLLTADPYRESAACTLMQTLADSGDRAALTQVYQDLRLRLREGLNTTPAPETEALYKKLLEASNRAEVRPVALVSAPTAPTGRHLPVPLTELLGRESAIAEVVVGLERARLLTLLGPGGVGKTRLSIASADVALPRFPDGVWFVDLAPLTEGAYVAETVARVLGVPPKAEQSAEERLIAHLSPRTLLLVLDNCEHLLDACAILAGQLLSTCPEFRVLATSRQALGVTGEQVYTVPSLALPEWADGDESAGRLNAEKNPSFLREYPGIELFVQRAVQANPAFRLDRRNALAVVAVCRHLDGIPLAIELAAARVRSLSVGEIESRLSDRFRLLTTGSRAALPRQQTLRALIDWSYELLNEQEKALLCRLSVFAGGWTLEAATQVCAGGNIDSWDIVDTLTALVEKNLVRYVLEPQGEGRYRLLETIRQYATDRLAETGTATEYHRAHSDYFLAFAEGIQPKLAGPEQGLGLDTLAAEHDNLQQALVFCEGDSESAQKGLRLMTTLGNYWFRRDHLHEARQRCAVFLALEANAEPTPERATASLLMGNLALCQGDNPAARKHYEETRDIRQHLGDRHGLAGALGSLGNVAHIQGDFEIARNYFEEALVLARESGNLNWQSVALTCLASVTFDQADYAASRAYTETALEICRQIGNRQTESSILNNLGRIARRQSAIPDAIRFYEQALAIDQELGRASQEAVTRCNLAVAYAASGNTANAAFHYGQALSHMREGGDLRPAAAMLVSVAVFLAPLSPDYGEAACRMLGASERVREEMGIPSTPTEQEELDDIEARLRQSLTLTAFAAAWAEGRAMTLAEAIAYTIRQAEREVKSVQETVTRP